MNQHGPPARSMLSALLASQGKLGSNNKTEENTEEKSSSTSPSNEAGVASSIPGSSNQNNKIFDRTTKVAKTKYSDHGTHAVIVDEESDSSGHVPSDFDDPQINSPLHTHEGVKSPLTPKKRASPGSRTKSNQKQQPSLLHAALTGTSNNDADMTHTSSHALAQEKVCLTNPSVPKSNDGSDNADGNLIVHKDDIIKIPTRKIEQHISNSDEKFVVNTDPLSVTSFQVIGLLGQGTFAQVFKCQNLDTGKMCAVKIVKNKPAYTRQAMVEIEVFKTMMDTKSKGKGLDTSNTNTGMGSNEQRDVKDFMVSLLCYFMYKSHLCLVFELLGQNLYELLKQRQFRGLPIRIVRDVVKQAVMGVTELSNRKIVHCDLKPENILLVSEETSDTLVHVKMKSSKGDSNEKEIGNTIKLIDFGSACFEDSSGFTYIQSRFYRSPEVLVGVNYDSAIDMWSLGCLAAELFLGLPILPGVNELDQLGRIREMIGEIPEWMLDQGKKTMKYFILNRDSYENGGDKVAWVLKTREEFVNSLSNEELERYGGKQKLEQPPANRYFKYKHLNEIVMHYGSSKTPEEKETLVLFVHFLKGLLNPDPCERWTAFQACSHPFITGNRVGLRLKVPDGHLQSDKDITWSPPWDPSVCRRKLSLKQVGRAQRRKAATPRLRDIPKEGRPKSLTSPNTLRMMNMTGAMSLGTFETQGDRHTPPVELNNTWYASQLAQSYGQVPLSASMGALSGAHDLQQMYQQQQESNLSMSLHQHIDTSIGPPPSLYSNQFQQIPQHHQQQHQNIPLMMGPQSFSGYYQQGIGVAPPGDLGYALQRPGVVPGTSVGMHQINQSLYMQQQQGLQPSSIGSLVQGNNSYNDLVSLSGSYMSMSNMSMPSNMQGSIPREYNMLQSQAQPAYQMSYGDGSYYDPYDQQKGQDQQTSFQYRGCSM